MAIQIRTSASKVISIHDEPSSLQFFIPSVHPGNYRIPGLNAPEDEFELCKFSFPANPRMGVPKARTVQYARPVKDKQGRKYIELLVQDAKTYVAEANENTKPMDEYGHLLQPPVSRHALDVPSEEVANEIERQFMMTDDSRRVSCSIGILAIDGDEPSDKEWAEVKDLRLNQMIYIVSEVDKWESKGIPSASDQSRRFAVELHRLGKLGVLPSWAIGKFNITSDTQVSCDRCNAVMVKGMPVCLNCKKVHDWKVAVSEGYVKPSDVPPARLKEAGLEAVAGK